jgi:hypothetical protein
MQDRHHCAGAPVAEDGAAAFDIGKEPAGIRIVLHRKRH